MFIFLKYICLYCFWLIELKIEAIPVPLIKYSDIPFTPIKLIHSGNFSIILLPFLLYILIHISINSSVYIFVKYKVGKHIDINVIIKINNENLKNEKYNEIPLPHSAYLSVFSQKLNIFTCSSSLTGRLQQGQNFVFSSKSFIFFNGRLASLCNLANSILPNPSKLLSKFT